MVAIEWAITYIALFYLGYTPGTFCYDLIHLLMTQQLRVQYVAQRHSDIVAMARDQTTNFWGGK